MSMHLEGPWLSTTGKRKGKKKWASAEAKRQAELLDQSWSELLKKHPAKKSPKVAQKVEVCQPRPYRRGEDQPRIPSLHGGVDSAPATKKAAPVYTGTKIKGIGTMHKSNAVPIFSDHEAVAIAQMRR